MIDLQDDPSTWKTGCELDAEIAKVLNYTCKATNEYSPHPTPYYSVMWDAMRLIVKWLVEDEGVGVEIYIDPDGAIVFIRTDVDVRQSASTAPLAIARALLIYTKGKQG